MPKFHNCCKDVCSLFQNLRWQCKFSKRWPGITQPTSHRSSCAAKPCVVQVFTYTCTHWFCRTHSDLLAAEKCCNLGAVVCLLPQGMKLSFADPSGRAVKGVGLRPLACWNCGFGSRWGQGCLSLVSVVFWQVEVSASVWSLVLPSVVFLSVILNPR
jgi:hypothetical protein